MMLIDRGGLWYRVLMACYGEEVGRLEDGGRSGSYSVRGVYMMLTSQEAPISDVLHI